MARKKLEDMNNGELYKHYKKQSHIAKAGKWASIVSPFAIVFGVKAGEYIEILGEQSYKLTIGCVLAIIVAVIAIFKEFKKDDKTKKFAGVVGWGLAFALVYFLSVALKDLALIIGTEFAGQFVATGFEYWGSYSANEANEYKSEARHDGSLHRKSEPKEVEEKPVNKVSGLI